MASLTKSYAIFLPTRLSELSSQTVGSLCFIKSRSSHHFILAPMCKMRSNNSRCSVGSENSSAHERKNQEKRISRERSSIEMDKAAGDANGRPRTSIEPESDVEQPSYDTEGTLNLLESISNDDQQQPVGAVEEDAQLVQPLEVAALQEGKSVWLVEDLMNKVKEAERNILMLNQARIHALEELEQTRFEKNSLQGKIDVLKAQLAEADAKLRFAYQVKAKAELLEEEVKDLREKLVKGVNTHKKLDRYEAEYKILQETVKTLQADLNKTADEERELECLRAENLSLQVEICNLKSAIEELQLKDETIMKLETEKFLKDQFAELELKTAQAETYAMKLTEVESEATILRNKLHKLEDCLAKVPAKESKHDKDDTACKLLQEKIAELQTALDQLRAENKLLEQVRSENQTLQQKVDLLEKEVLESDAEIISQLETYQEEITAFQASLKQLEKENSAVGEAVDDLPWEFWSQLLLCIDALLLEDKIELAEAADLRDLIWQRDPGIKDTYIANGGKMDVDLMSSLLDLIKKTNRHGLHIVHIAAEMAPVAKVGGLGDVITGLGKALQKKGHLVEVVLPKYDCMDYTKISNLKVLEKELNSYFDGQFFRSKIWLGVVEGLPVYFIEPLHPGKFFWRGKIYGENDDFRRFTFFSRAALEFLVLAKKNPDIIHCHDWHTAAVAPLFWDAYMPMKLSSARIAFTCHNFEYQGTEAPEALASCGLNPQQYYRLDRMQDNFIPGRINLLKGGVVFSNIVTTVSPTYAQEVQGPECGRGLHVTLKDHGQKFFGILNGIDVESWNPTTDALLKYQYSPEDLTGKEANKSALTAQLRLAGNGTDMGKPLVGCITRLVPQKGLHLIRHALCRTLELGGQFVLLGSSPIPHIQHEFETIAHEFNNHPHARLILKYDESLSHTLYAASDILVIPSIFEPCGLTQMIAMRYGVIPIVRRTGGLNDSVFDVDDETIPIQRRNGFTFSVANEEGLNSALDRALAYYKRRSKWWSELVKKVMRMDFSWESSAEQYEELFQKAIARARSRTFDKI